MIPKTGIHFSQIMLLSGLSPSPEFCDRRNRFAGWNGRGFYASGWLRESSSRL
jgi:hypothetical protein